MGKRGGGIVTSRYIESKDIPMGKNGAILNLNWCGVFQAEVPKPVVTGGAEIHKTQHSFHSGFGALGTTAYRYRHGPRIF